MKGDRSADVERIIAHCRVILSVAAFVTVYIDPTRPTLTRWMPLTGGPFTLDPWALAVMIAHLDENDTAIVSASKAGLEEANQRHANFPQDNAI